ncbi:MAG: ABC transporter transmembrane domain-containing protein [Novosphingobium sp.]
MRRLKVALPGWRMIAPIAVAIAQAGTTLGGAALVHRAGQTPAAWAPIIMAVAALLGTYALEVLRRRLCEAIGWREVAQVRRLLLRKVLKADPAVIARQRHGALLQVFVGDLSARRQWWSDGLPRALTAPVLLLALFGWAGWQSLSLAMWIGGIVLLALAVGIGLLRPLRTAVGNVRRARGRMSAFASDRIARAATVDRPGSPRAGLRRLDRRSDELNRAAFHRAWLTGLLRGLPHLTTSLILMVVLVGGGHTSGTIVVIGTAGLALADLARAAELLIPARISARRIERLMQLPARKQGARVKRVDLVLVTTSDPAEPTMDQL